jgi:exodeoxyribonuclease V alpha subunit
MSETESLVEIQGAIKKIIFNRDNYMIGILLTDKAEQVTFKGNMFGIEKNEKMIFKGKWVEHFKYGIQFEVQRWERPIPKTKEKIIVYLTSSFVKGCGEKQALRIVEKLGENTIETIINEGESALIGIKGIGKRKARTITDSVRTTYELQNIIAELNEYGINPENTIKIYKEYGTKTKEILKNNPYELIRMKLLSFPAADEIARKIGIFPLSSIRIEACINYVLQRTCFLTGHCFIPETDLINCAIQLLNENTDEEDKANENDILQSIYNLEEKTIIIEDGKVYPKYLYIFETKLAEKIHYILSSKKGNDNINDKKLERYIKKYQLKHRIILGEEQKEAIRTILKNNFSVLTGSAGTGKTTVVKAIIYIYNKFFPNRKISLSAPIGKASRNLQEATGHFAQTNHRLLGFKQNLNNGPGFEYNDDNKLSYDFYIVDEMSMVDLHMAYALTSAMENRAKVLFIGDINQLPSINAGNVLKDLLDSKYVPKVELSEIYRQAVNSQIILNSHRVNNGEFIEVDHSKEDMYFINKQTDEDIKSTIIQSVLRFIDLGYDVSDLLVLSPIKKGIIGTIELNNELQQVLNPKNKNKKEVHHGKRIFRVGDKIMQTVNDSEKGIYNGDLGIITDIVKEKSTNKNGKEVEVDTIYSDFQGTKVKHTRDEWNELELGYSISIHKSQGSQAPIVIIPISKSHYNMLVRNLIYTGMTRAEKKLVLIGQQSAMAIAISNNKIIHRNTFLADRLDMLQKYKECVLENIKTTNNIVGG